jgi:FKBP-type peptidyl-prolyl cis-trans isomerase SlyD
MEVVKDHFVVIEYTVRLKDGSHVKGENGPVSMNFIAGYDQILPALEHRLLGLEEGDERQFVVPAAQAFGERDPARVRTKLYKQFPEGVRLPEGKWIMATDSQTHAQYAYFVKEKNEEGVVLDFNHPLAGEDLYYDVKVVKVRPALQEELEFLRPCEFGSGPGEEASGSFSRH